VEISVLVRVLKLILLACKRPLKERGVERPEPALRLSNLHKTVHVLCINRLYVQRIVLLLIVESFL
jgi:hypothetical protein